MAILIPYSAEYKDRAIKMFDEFKSKKITYSIWARIFENPWRHEDEVPAYMMLEGEEIVGIIGLIYGHRLINGKEVKTCNLTSWIVKPEHRNESLLLVMAILRLKGYTLLNLTPSKNVRTLFQKIGFDKADTQEILFLPIPNFKKVKSTSELVKNVDGLNDNDKKIYLDHKDYGAKFLLSYDETEYCLVVYTKRTKKGIPFNHIHYISNYNFFRKHYKKIIFDIFRKSCACLTMIDSRMLKNENYSGSIRVNYLFPKYFKSSQLELDEIDSLYSEFVLLIHI